MLEADATRPRWPAWFGLAALGMSLVIAAFVSAIVFVVAEAGGADVDTDDGAVNIVATLIQDAALIGCAVWLAARVTRPRLAHFGLRGIPFLRGLKWAAIAFAIYFVFGIIYAAVADPDPQTTLRDLGAGESAALTVVIGILVVGVAPVIEEVFFRGFMFTALRTRFGFLAAAGLDGLIFGMIHAPTGLEAVPPLIVLGIAFCVAYEATGSILPAIALHALNNMVAFGVDKDGSWAVAGATAGTVLAACILLPLRSRTLK